MKPRHKTSLLPRLGINIDHVATLRQLRNTPYPSVVDAALTVIDAGADQITVHLREDRRHIQDADVFELKKKISVPLNLEMAVSEPILKIAEKLRPSWTCLVPEKRTEVTTEGGLDVKKLYKKIAIATARLQKKKIKVSWFIEPDLQAVELAARAGADAVELHTGRYCLAVQGALGKRSPQIAEQEFKRIHKAGLLAIQEGIHPHVGHGFDYENVQAIAALDLFEEFNIGHSVVCRAVMVGLRQATREMKAAIIAP